MQWDTTRSISHTALENPFWPTWKCFGPMFFFFFWSKSKETCWTTINWTEKTQTWIANKTHINTFTTKGEPQLICSNNSPITNSIKIYQQIKHAIHTDHPHHQCQDQPSEPIRLLYLGTYCILVSFTVFNTSSTQVPLCNTGLSPTCCNQE